jgi:hypothetical protein
LVRYNDIEIIIISSGVYPGYDGLHIDKTADIAIGSFVDIHRKTGLGIYQV